MSKFDEKFIKKYDEESNKGYMLELAIEYPKNLRDLHSDLPFLPERIKIEKSNKLIRNLYDKKTYVVHMRALKQVLNRGLVLKISLSNSL